MTAGNNGSGTPESDDPFAYLYRSEGGEGGPGEGQASQYGGPAQQPGVPRTSYQRPTRVGERQYGQQQPYGQQPANPTYAAPETLPGGAPRRAAGHGGGRGSGPNSKGLLIGAIAVVAVVVIGIGAAMLTNGDSEEQGPDDTGGGPAPSETVSEEPSEKPSMEPKPELPKQDAASLRLDGPASVASDVEGAKAKGGTYVANMNAEGASASWKVDVEEGGSYRLYVRYGVPGKDADLTLTVNGKQDGRPVSMKNFGHAPEGDWARGWTETWSIVHLNEGTNAVKLSCEKGNSCEVNLDQVWLKEEQG
ncbi:carbohydrate-binding protein [Streptomyces sp. TP-A0874]|uniref:carbohydrate-binding protein n=1 Tax=Streptomyces sp. TP-A0874 TaxID=549819 RepID=UPI0008530A11|nr:carbohydrate-binding protein [Streptomyces sp. TP-A0874]